MFVARLVATLTWIIGMGSLVLFGTFLWTERLGVIDLRLTNRSLLVWDASLCLLFFLQHSTLIRRSVRDAVKRAIPDYCQGVAYTFASAVVLLALILLWQHSAVNLYALRGAGAWIPRVASLLVVVGFVWGTRSLERFDAFGIDEYLAHIQCGQSPPPRLTVNGPYGLVRHPFYALAIVALWAAPVLSLDRLLLNILFTGWVVLGASLEERDLLAEFGEEYASYRQAVPMFVPRGWARLRKAGKAKAVSGGRAA
jgi:protein-S-isoprenylcysteine O-methyltransferase Ste14